MRARDPQEREAQRLFRAAEHQTALESYAQRERVHIADRQRHAEDAALEAAHGDRQADKRTSVIAQTSNEHLDELNARAQAIRLQEGELGEDSVGVPGRPYRLHKHDEVQIHRSIRHPEREQLRNGTVAEVIEVDPDYGRVGLRLSAGWQVTLDREQLAHADIRLAYVQHPFPAQGRAADTAHLLVAEHNTREGAYVALTRAREQTDLYASREQLVIEESDGYLEPLVERGSRSEPDIPSIRYPLAHEAQIAQVHVRELDQGREPERIHQRPDTQTVERSGGSGRVRPRLLPTPCRRAGRSATQASGARAAARLHDRSLQSPGGREQPGAPPTPHQLHGPP